MAGRAGRETLWGCERQKALGKLNCLLYPMKLKVPLGSGTALELRRHKGPLESQGAFWPCVVKLISIPVLSLDFSGFLSPGKLRVSCAPPSPAKASPQLKVPAGASDLTPNTGWDHSTPNCKWIKRGPTLGCFAHSSPHPHCTASNSEGGGRCWITRMTSSQSPHCASVKRKAHPSLSASHWLTQTPQCILFLCFLCYPALLGSHCIPSTFQTQKKYPLLRGLLFVHSLRCYRQGHSQVSQ